MLLIIFYAAFIIGFLELLNTSLDNLYYLEQVQIHIIQALTFKKSTNVFISGDNRSVRALDIVRIYASLIQG
jgi:hypothetical protein